MRYEEKEAREYVIRACRELVDNRLIARTWGNVSARISDTQFVITPSGRGYDTLRPEDLVVVEIADCSYQGDVKPSSEKGIHADVYAVKDEVNFVIHTHQHYASAVCAEGENTDFAPCAGYGLPGTKKLRSRVKECVKAFPSKDMFLMAKHGALCFGTSFETAFAAAFELENKCKDLYESRINESGDKAINDPEVKEALREMSMKPWLDDYAQMYGFGNTPVDNDEEALQIICAKNSAAAAYVKKAKPMGVFDVMLQHLVFKYKYSKLK